MGKKNTRSIYKNQSREALVEVYFRKHYVELCQSVNRLLVDQALSEDLVQEVFLKVWDRKDKIDFNDRFIFYLKRSCHHAALAFLTSKNFKLDTDHSSLLTDHTSSDQPIVQTELETAIRSAIGQLPEKTRLVFTLCRYEDMSYKEVATQLSISIKSVEKHMSIALKKLRVLLKNHLAILLWLTSLF